MSLRGEVGPLTAARSQLRAERDEALFLLYIYKEEAAFLSEKHRSK
ncbi:MAG TPA: hypothetical protein H9956_08090 [Candidatus Eisenbergiella pullicola]|nr:hypothetical protein [Candidatus Eisenbergiella pullicola]